MKLYFAPRTRAVRPRWLLEELEVPYELVRLDLSKQENKTPAYLAVHPFGEVPALVDGAVTLFESLSICLYLADRYPDRRLAPPLDAPERGAYYQWMVFAEAILDPVVVDFYLHAQLPEEQKASMDPQAVARKRARLNEILEVAGAALDGREFIVGDRFTAADVVMASILHLAHTLHLLEGHPRLLEYTMVHSKRPAVRRAVSA